MNFDLPSSRGAGRDDLGIMARKNGLLWFGDDVVSREGNESSKKTTKGKRLLVVLLVALFVVAVAAGAAFRFGYHMYQTLPSPSELQNIHPPLSSKLFAADGTLVHEFSIERRSWVPLEDIPADLQHAVISIEDRRFYSHWGIDVRRIFGAVVADVLAGEYVQGASTLTQQLARNVYLSFRTSLIRKIREAMTAVQIEKNYTKREILELYLNQVYLGAGVYGMEAASMRYFSKSVDELTLNECAVLGGMIQLPEHYRPDKPKNLKRIRNRRNAVLRSMRVMGYIDSRQMELTAQDSIPSNPTKPGSKVAPYFVETVRRYIERNYGENMLYNEGLAIHTTLDYDAHDVVDKAVSSHLDTLQKKTNRIFLDSTKAYRDLGVTRSFFLEHFDSLYALNKETYEALPDSHQLRKVQAAVFAMDVHTGAVRVLVGGRDFSESKFNRALQARRQPGSAFKPIVYAAALEKGYTPASVLLDQPITLETPEGIWRPENYEREFYGPVPLRYALMKSINLVSIRVFRDLGAHEVISLARRMGLRQRLNPVPALAIGACEALPVEMVLAYNVFPNHGVRVEPYYIERILDKNGRVLELRKPDEGEQVVSPQTAYLMTSLLSSVVTSGTGASIPAKGFTRAAGGKTGTTNDYSDAWFVGFTPQVSCAVWVGIDERRSMGYGVTGARGAIPIWVPTMKSLHRDRPSAKFEPPQGIVAARICEQTHGLATRYCPNTSREIFAAEHLPDTCDVHVLGRRRNKNDVLNYFGTQSRPRKSDEDTKRSRSLMF